jgi:hypothetical protein
MAIEEPPRGRTTGDLLDALIKSQHETNQLLVQLINATRDVRSWLQILFTIILLGGGIIVLNIVNHS